MTSRTIRVQPVRCYEVDRVARCMVFRCDLGIFAEIWVDYESEPVHIATVNNSEPTYAEVRLAVQAFRAGVEHGRNWAKDRIQAQDFARTKAGL